MAPEKSSDAMTKERFAAIVEAYGAEARRWPEADRDAALAFVQANPAIAAPVLDEARALDAVLDADAAPAQRNDLLAARILVSAKRETAARGRLDWKPLAALAACAVFGLVAGFGVGRSAPSATPPVIAQTHDERDADAALDAAFGMLDIDVSEQEG